ncbi:hypothetical protein OC834_005687 [Tilletia horrida]|nr:hypothetical protein OC834_005687 [Tilletia horrida]
MTAAGPGTAIEVEDTEESDLGASATATDVLPNTAPPALSPCRACYMAGDVCHIAPGGLTCTACTKNASNVNRRVPAFKGQEAELRVRIYKRLLEHAGEGEQYVPPKINPANDWTSKYLKDVFGEKALEHPDIRSHLGRSGTRTVPGTRTRTPLPTAANAPAHVQPYLASGSNTTAPTYDLNSVDSERTRKRALDKNRKTIQHHKKALKRARRHRQALKAMTFDETDEDDE